ncbi:hypothetical protein [Corynebacterium halotolerans]|uniref:hypothetical protein n=1 Tax=Corynebacterium halotolerans TaxID=225326 RepID=UPI00047DBA7A|nr:hypothetical protein [Corynebacterium halotolerans]
MPSPVPTPLDLGLIASAFLRSIPAALVIAVVAGGISAGVLSQTDPVYEVNTQVSLGSPADTSLDPQTLETLGPLYSSIANDEATKDIVRQRTGLDDPALTTSTTSVPGMIEVSARAGSVGEARNVAAAVVESMSRRSDYLYSESTQSLAEDVERRTAAIREQIDNRREEDEDADVSDLEGQIDMILQDTRDERMQHVQPIVLSQSDNDGEPVWPRLWQTSLVVGLLVFLLAQIPLTVWKLRRHRRADALWLRLIGHRYGVDRESALADGGLTPLAEARVSTALAEGGDVLILGDVDTGGIFDAYDAERLHRAGWLDPWWREVSPPDLQLGVVVIDKGDRRANLADTAVERLMESGVPAFVVVRSGKRKANGDGAEDRDRS